MLEFICCSKLMDYDGGVNREHKIIKIDVPELEKWLLDSRSTNCGEIREVVEIKIKKESAA